MSLVVKKGSNSRFCTSGGMPLPVSATSRMTTSVTRSASRFAIEPGAQGDLAVLADAVGGVLDEIDQHLLDLLRVNAELERRTASSEREPDVGLFQLRLEQRLDLAQRLIGGHGRQVRIGGPREQEHVLDDAFRGG